MIFRIFLFSLLASLSLGQLSAQELVDRFVEHYIDSDRERIYSARFLGLPVFQNPADMWSIQEIITEVAPDLIIESGTAYGGSSLFFASVLRLVNPLGRVVTIDLNPGMDGAIANLSRQPILQRQVKALYESIEVIRGNSLDPGLLRRLARRAEGKKVLVTLDSCHNYEHVLKEIEAYGPLVSPGSYLIVQDTIIDRREAWIEEFGGCPGYSGRGGPGRAVSEFLQKSDRFETDSSRERFLLTFYPGGYLKKIR